MKRTGYRLIVTVLFLGQTLCMGVKAEDSDSLPGVLLPGAPVLDGKPDDAFWNKAETVSGFVTIENKPADPDTTVKIGYTPKGIYILFLCDHPESKPLTCSETDHDDLHRDNWVAVFLDPGRTNRYYHFMANPRGVKQEEYRGDISWTCDWKVATGKIPGKWVVEIFIPFSAVKLNTKSVWGINFTRRNPDTDRASLWTQWHHTGGSFHRPALFASYGPLKIDLKQYTCSSRLDIPPVCWPGKNTATVTVRNRSPKTRKAVVTLNVYDETRKLLSSTTANMIAGGKKEASSKMAFVLPETGLFYLEAVTRNANTKKESHRTYYTRVRAIDQPVMFMDSPKSGVAFAPERKNPLKLRVAIPPSVLKGKGHSGTIAFQAIQPSDRVWASLPAKPIRKNEVAVDWPIEKWPAGQYRIEALVQAGDWQKAVGKGLFIVPKKVENYVRIDEFGRTVVKQPGKDERLFFPIGLFAAKILDEKVMKQLSDAGINALQDYGFTRPKVDTRKRYEKCQQYLDLALKHGVMVLPSIKGFAQPYKPKTPPDPLKLPAGSIEDAMEIVLDYRHHPAVLSWYSGDEPEIHACKPKKLTEYYHLLKDLDPLHPVSVAFCHPYALSQYCDSYDVAMPDKYPFPLMVNNSYGIMNWFFGAVHKQLVGRKPFWAVLQAYDRIMDTPSLTKFPRTYPLYKEIRLMTFQSLTWGARGVWYYAWHWMNRNPPKYERMKKDLFRVTREISALSPILLSKKQEPAVIPSAGQVTGIWLEHDGAWYLILANGNLKERQVSVELPKGLIGKTVNSIVKIVGGKKEQSCPNTKMLNGKLQVKLSSMEVLVIKMSVNK